MVHIVTAYIVMASIVMVYIVMAYIVVASIVMAYLVIAFRMGWAEHTLGVCAGAWAGHCSKGRLASQ